MFTRGYPSLAFRDIEKKLKDSQLHVVPVINNIKLDLALESIESTLALADKYEAKVVYCYYVFYNKDDYVIPRDYYDAYSKAFIAEVDAYNQFVRKQNFKSPWRVVAFIVADGLKIGFEFIDERLHEKDITPSDEKIEELEAKFYSEVEEKKEKDNNEKERKLEELREYILNDPEFELYARNQNLRYEYLRKLYYEDRFSSHMELLEPFGAPHIGKAKNFMDQLSMIYKQNKKEEE